MLGSRKLLQFNVFVATLALIGAVDQLAQAAAFCLENFARFDEQLGRRQGSCALNADWKKSIIT